MSVRSSKSSAGSAAGRLARQTASVVRSLPPRPLRKDKVESIRKLLSGRREAIATELDRTTSEILNEDQSYTDSIDQASADADRSFALQMKSRSRESIWEIDAAIRRIEEGTFGECERCGEIISEARILANPCTTLCIDCKGELESELGRYPGRG